MRIAERAEALALEGAAPFDPMGDGRARSDKIMLPESMMDEPEELRQHGFRGKQALLNLLLRDLLAQNDFKRLRGLEEDHFDFRHKGKHLHPIA